jgi:hypothetical protein
LSTVIGPGPHEAGWAFGPDSNGSLDVGPVAAQWNWLINDMPRKGVAAGLVGTLRGLLSGSLSPVWLLFAFATIRRDDR